jgi:hypothetical protein
LFCSIGVQSHGVPGSLSLEGWLEKAAPNATPSRCQVLCIAVISLIQGVPGPPPHHFLGWVVGGEGQANSTSNRRFVPSGCKFQRGSPLPPPGVGGGSDPFSEFTFDLFD